MAEGTPLEIAPKEVKRRLKAGESLRLVDVREPFEVAQAKIEGADLIPMGSIPKALPLLEDEAAPIVVICHHGMRSLQVVGWLRQQGVQNCQSMSGGIDLWSQEVDAAIPRY